MSQFPFTQTQLAEDFRALGVNAGGIVMLHTSVRAVGDVLGGPNTILQALLDTLTPVGTLMMYAGWENIPDYVEELPAEEHQFYYDNHPPFDPAIARSARGYGVMVEFLRTWPGTRRSLNPEASMVALGAQADELTREHPLDYGYGAGSPLAKLVALWGQVLMLGAPLDAITLLHHAEYLARLRHKNVIHYTCPILRDGQKVWVTVEDFDTSEPHADYSFEQIALAYLAEGKGQHGKVGDADSYLFDAADLVGFAVRWLEARFGDDSQSERTPRQ